MNIHFMQKHPSICGYIIVFVIWFASTTLVAFFHYTFPYVVWLSTFLLILCIWWLLFRMILNSYLSRWKKEKEDLHVNSLALVGISSLPYFSLFIAISPLFYRYISCKSSMTMMMWLSWLLYSIIAIILALGSSSLEEHRLKSKEFNYKLMHRIKY